jgi:hypothetical protein
MNNSLLWFSLHELYFSISIMVMNSIYIIHFVMNYY